MNGKVSRGMKGCVSESVSRCVSGQLRFVWGGS